MAAASSSRCVTRAGFSRSEVGWVERSDTHQPRSIGAQVLAELRLRSMMGIAALNPSYIAPGTPITSLGIGSRRHQPTRR